MAKLYCLGDSWGWGWAGTDKRGNHLPPFVNNYCQVLATKLGLELVNYSRPGNSFPQITQQFFRRLAPVLQPDDVVFFTIPPDVRWHRAIPRGLNGTDNQYGWEDDEDTISTLYYRGEFFEKLVAPGNVIGDDTFCYLESEIAQNNFNPYWFKYNTSLQLIAITYYCESKNITCAMQHNYGNLDDLLWAAPKDLLLDEKHSMWEWLGLPPLKNTLDFDVVDGDGPNQSALPEGMTMRDLQQMFVEKLLMQAEGGGIDWHPNAESHKHIGGILYDKLSKRMG